MATIVDLDETGESMWSAVTASWNEQARHDAFVQHCFTRGSLAAAGARYRAWLDKQPDDVRAQRMRDRVVFLSTQALLTSEPRPGREGLLRSPWLMVFVMVGAALGAALGFLWGGRP